MSTLRDAATWEKSNTVDIVKQMARLAELRESGALTDEQYATAKAQLLGLPIPQSTSAAAAETPRRAPLLATLAAVVALVAGGVAIFATAGDDTSAWEAPEGLHLEV